jgi:hypothetical protein
VIVAEEREMAEQNDSTDLPSNVVRDDGLILQIRQEDLLSQPPTDADFVGVLASSTEARPSYFRGTRIDGRAYDRVSMKFSDRERIWARAKDTGDTVTYRLTTANTYATGRP